jgi:hypothetical protein
MEENRRTLVASCNMLEGLEKYFLVGWTIIT